MNIMKRGGAQGRGGGEVEGGRGGGAAVGGAGDADGTGAEEGGGGSYHGLNCVLGLGGLIYSTSEGEGFIYIDIEGVMVSTLSQSGT